MNLLQLTQAVKRESGMAGGGPLSVSTTVLQEQRLFAWVNWAARDITLAREDWRFRRANATLASTTDQANTAADFGLTDFASWKPATRFYKPSTYRVSDGLSMERELVWMDYDQFRKTYTIGTQTPGMATNWTISPSEEFLLGPAPDSAHFIRADYVRDYTDLVLDTDTPIIPARFHMLIVWRALREYGGFDAASEVFQRADQNYNSMWPQLLQSQTEAPTIASLSLA